MRVAAASHRPPTQSLAVATMGVRMELFESNKKGQVGRCGIIRVAYQKEYRCSCGRCLHGSNANRNLLTLVLLCMSIDQSDRRSVTGIPVFCTKQR